jgi:lysozyme family protein
MRYSDIWPRYAKYWDGMTINASRVQEFTTEAQYAIKNKFTYSVVESKTRIPWQMIACIHRREGDAEFNTYLGNGQLLSEKTTEVPADRGPFTGPNAFIDGCVDAIHYEKWDTISDWRVEKQLYYMLLFNGVGTEAWTPPRPSSYIFGGTNIQMPGKWVADHKYSSTVMDPQPGCAPLLWMIGKLDPSVTFTRETS